MLEKISRKDNPQSVIGVFEQKFHKLVDINKTINRCHVVLEQIRDPGNLGTIIRTIDAVGADGVILIDQCCDPYSVECIRATMGSTFSVPIFTASLDEFKDWAKDWKGSIIGTTLQSSVDFREVTPKKPLLLMMGNEQAGLSEDLRQRNGDRLSPPPDEWPRRQSQFVCGHRDLPLCAARALDIK